MDHPLKASYAIAKEPIYPHRGPPSTSAIETFRDGPFRPRYAAFRTSIRNDGWSFANSAPRGRDPTKSFQSRGTLLEFVGQKNRLFGAELQRALVSHTHRQILLYSACEMLPIKSNCVTIDNKDEKARDRFGVPKPIIRFDIGSYARRGLSKARDFHDWIFAQMGVEKDARWLEMDDKSGRDTPDLGSGHIIGTTRMGDNPKESVVDSYGRARDCPNLVILGSSIFPTSAVANPTLTIAALTLRSVLHIITNRRLYGL
jgi:choline dehydrogenase-like flavoprotein